MAHRSKELRIFSAHAHDQTCLDNPQAVSGSLLYAQTNEVYKNRETDVSFCTSRLVMTHRYYIIFGVRLKRIIEIPR